MQKLSHKKCIGLVISLLFLLVSAIPVFSQDSDLVKLHVADSVLSKRGELYFSFDLPGNISIRQVSQAISIDRYNGLRVWAYANRREFEWFRSLDLQFSIERQIRGLKVSPKSLKSGGWNHFPSYLEYLSVMKKFQDNYPGLCIVSEFGKSVKGRSLLCAKISNHPEINQDKPQVLYVGSIHGDEPVAYVLMLRLIDYLLGNYNQPSIKSLVDSAQIWICPLANPDGVFFGGDSSVLDGTRYNANSVDLNRNFPDIDGNPHPDGNDWQPETVAMMGFLKAHHTCLSANFHSGSEVFNYPWDAWATRHPDDAWFQQVGRAYADTVHAWSPPGFFTDENNGITDGYDWYSVNGGRQDYANYFTGCREVTIELDADKMPPDNQLDSFWTYHYRSLLGYLKQSSYGIYGKITDRQTALPLKANVKVLNHDQNGSQVTSDSVNGMFYRLIAPGTYSLQISSPGYYLQNYQSVEVKPGTKVYLNIQLDKASGNKALLDSIEILAGPNPVVDFLSLTTSVGVDLPISVDIFDISGKNLGKYYFASALGDLTLNLKDLSKGLYIIRISLAGKNIARKIVKY